MNKKKFVKIILIYLSLFVFVLIFKNQRNKIYEPTLALTTEYDDVTSEVNGETEEEFIYVHISGEVNYPGLIKLDREERLFEAIEKAGGLTEDADIDRINLSKILSDQDKIYIPKVGEGGDYIITNSSPLVNINTCDKNDLMTLDGIGEKTAEKILKYRENHRFESIEDLQNVEGIGPQKFESIKEYITI